MNRYEEEQYFKTIWNSVFFSSKETKDPIYTERTKKRRKKEYEQLVISLKFLKDLKEKESLNDEKTYSFIKPIYTDEDIEFLKYAVKNRELTIHDLTFDEAIIVGFKGEDYRRISRKISTFNFDNQTEVNEFYKKLNKVNKDSLTYNVALSLHKECKKKK